MLRLTSLMLTFLLLVTEGTDAGPLARERPAAAHFAAVEGPAPGAPLVHGTYTNGCLVGARRLPGDSPSLQVLRPSRNRAWGHPALVRVVTALADHVAASGHQGILVGDLAQPSGGPMPFGHTSHQTGLDADIWLTPLPSRRLTRDELEAFAPPSMVDLQTATVTLAFGAAQVAMLRRAAEHPDVTRIFVSPPIKQALCDRTPEADRAWLGKIRPWAGHTAHMHIRIACPVDSDSCKDQNPVPDGDGCGAELASWLTDTTWRSTGTRPHVPEKGLRLSAMPAACRRLVK